MVRKMITESDVKQADAYVAQIRGEVQRALNAVVHSLDPATENQTQQTVGMAAAQISAVSQALAVLLVTQHWRDTMATAMKAEREEDATWDALAKSLSEYMLRQITLLPTSLQMGGFEAHDFKRRTIEEVARVIQFTQALARGYEMTAEICQENGYDLDKVMAGDTDELRKVMIALHAKTGVKPHPALAETLGIDLTQMQGGPDPEAVHRAAIAEALGVDPAQVVELSPGVFTREGEKPPEGGPAVG